MISPLAYVDSAAKIGKNVTIQPFAFIEGNVEIGDDCIIMSGAKILHGTRMGKGNRYITMPFWVPNRKTSTIRERAVC